MADDSNNSVPTLFGVDPYFSGRSNLNLPVWLGGKQKLCFKMVLQKAKKPLRYAAPDWRFVLVTYG